MKTINIRGKNNVDEITKLLDESFEPTRNGVDKFDCAFISHKNQFDNICRIFIDGPTIPSTNFNESINIPHIITEINKKIRGYKAQDLRNACFDEMLFIDINSIIEKLISCRLACVHCKINVLILYKNVRDPVQWTLDRINNSLGHNTGNIQISCLKCNIQRGTKSFIKFNTTKCQKINKILNAFDV